MADEGKKNEKKETNPEELQMEKTLLLAFSVFISAAVGYVLISLVGNIPGDAENARNWVIATLFIIAFTLFIVIYIVEYFPSTRIWLKIGVIISSTMAFLSFSRFYKFYGEYIEATTEVEYDKVQWAYNSCLLFLALMGLLLILQGIKYRKEKKDKWEIACYVTGATLILISIAFIVFVSPIASPPSTGGIIE